MQRWVVMADRAEHDAYETPYPLAVAIVDRLQEDGLWQRSSDAPYILEPSVGEGTFIKAICLREAAVKKVDCCDVRDVLKTRDCKVAQNFSHVPFEEFAGRLRGYDLVIGNPPFSLAESHAMRGMQLLSKNGSLAFLLRLNFLGGIERQAGLWTLQWLRYVYVLDKRPGFRKVGSGTDMTEYGVFVFHRPDPSRHLSSQEPLLRFLNWSSYFHRHKRGEHL